MQTQIDTMTLAWKIYRQSKLTMTFSKALKYAWKLAKSSEISLTKQELILKVKTKAMYNQIEYGYTIKHKREIHVPTDYYNLNLLIHQLGV